MADIIIRGAGWMGGGEDLANWQSGEEKHFFRGKRLTQVSRGDRVYFVENGVITGYATYDDYAPRYGENMTETGWLDAYILTGPYTAIEPVTMTNGYAGQWRARYVHTVDGLVDRLKRVAP